MFSAAARALYLDYPKSRILSHVYIGSMGAVVNVSVLPLSANVALLLLAAALVLWDVAHYGVGAGDWSVVVYLVKTMGGDFLAGKLDSLEWQLVLAFAFAVLLPAAVYFGGSVEAWGPITLALFLVQLVCEFGDGHLEEWTFFRWRYSFELCTLLLVLLVHWRPHELRVIQIDLVTCLCYRLANFLLILAPPSPSQFVNMLLFRVLGWYTGTPIVHVTSAAVATAVLKASSHKGRALEYLIASPAWLPILSLESVDGAQWSRMRTDFDALLKLLPPPERLQELASQHTRELLASTEARIDAAAIGRLTLSTFIAYLFEGQPWRPEFELFLSAAQEWRGEISVRRRGDKGVQRKAIALLVDGLLRPSKLWSLYGERWAEPEHFSLLMQPFIISPVINVADIMCAVALEAARLGGADKVTLDGVLRAMHPFPILERYVDKDVEVGGRVAVQAGSQCIIFTQDLRGSVAWPVFGAGARSCAGMHLAMPFLKVLLTDLCGPGAKGRFDPLSGHAQSGRHHDGQLGLGEAVYFYSTVLRAVAGARGGGVQQCPRHGD